MSKNICNNCGRVGHIFYQCKLPISSFGIIVFKKIDNQYKYLMLRRKDSFSYIDFIRGKYSIHNLIQIQSIVDDMSNSEKARLLTNSFDELWKLLWLDRSNQHKNEELHSGRKFDTLNNANNPYNLTNIIKNSQTNWIDPEWEFPKGRRNINECDVACALREFEEETGINTNEIILIDNVLTFEESFIGSNNKPYKHKYFLATLKKDADYYTLENYQDSEVSKLGWKSIDECISLIRPSNLEKKKLISNINNVLEEYRLFI